MRCGGGVFALQVEKAANIIDYVFNQGGGGGDIYSGTSACGKEGM